MASATLSTPVGLPEGESRIVLYDIDWEGYSTMLALVGDRPAPRLAYLEGSLELMSPGYRHETVAERLDDVIKQIAMGLRFPVRSAGHTTFRRRDRSRGIEGDKTYYIANERQVRGKDEIDLETDPPPDLAIEVEVSRSAINRLAIYAGLGVSEVWRCDGQSLKILRLGPEGRYFPAAASQVIPYVSADEILYWVQKPPDVSETDWLLLLNDWVRDTLAPRRLAHGNVEESSPPKTEEN